MKRYIFTICMISHIGLPGLAHGQEQQVYSPYPTNTIYSESDMLYQQEMQRRVDEARERVESGPDNAGGRDPYATFHGRMPDHPGDYRDAYDRGEFRGGESNLVPSRAFNID